MPSALSTRMPVEVSSVKRICRYVDQLRSFGQLGFTGSIAGSAAAMLPTSAEAAAQTRMAPENMSDPGEGARAPCAAHLLGNGGFLAVDDHDVGHRDAGAAV